LNFSFCVQVNGINLLRIPARDAYAYGLNLLDSLFSKEELFTSLLFKSKKSEKPGLDSVRVEKLLGKFIYVAIYARKHATLHSHACMLVQLMACLSQHTYFLSHSLH
jgi:hypothetical protein